MVGVSKGRVWPVVVTTEPYQCEAGYQPPNIEVGVTLVYVTRLPQAPTHIYLRHPCTDSRGFSCRGLGEQRDLRTVHAGNPFRLSTEKDQRCAIRRNEQPASGRMECGQRRK
ncbi:uncharacterized protein LOC116185798 isoform X2 [Apis dorsata]|uniref:uncharacterized protein LOC116185798 isoform X2 n=1 Tax=Apis dorsata TaxID=7462 RepID=UPI001293ED29|nr:uncharacterized protein LOC116185798 isoform X2 [Apis dorsata]